MSTLFSGTPEEFRQYIPVTFNYSMAGILPYLETTAEDLLPRFLGATITEQIKNARTNQGDPDDQATVLMARALSLAQSSVAKLAMAAYLPFAEVQIGDDGITVTAVDGRKAAFEYQTNKLSRQLIESGWEQLDKLIRHIAENAVVFTGWPACPYNVDYKDSLFQSATEFSRYYPIQDKWLTFWALRPFIMAVEESRGADATDRIALLPTATPAPKIDRLTKTLRRAIAYEAVIRAIPKLSVEIAGANVQVNYASQFGNANYYQPPGRELLDWVINNIRLDAEIAWQSFDKGYYDLLPITTPLFDTFGTGILDSDGHGLIMF